MQCWVLDLFIDLVLVLSYVQRLWDFHILYLAVADPEGAQQARAPSKFWSTMFY